MTMQNETLTNPQLSQASGAQMGCKPRSPRTSGKALLFAAGIVGSAAVCYLIYLTTRLLFPEMATEYLAADLRPQLVTIVAWIMFGVMILVSLLTFLRLALFQQNFLRAVVVICFWVGCYAWLSLASPQVEQVYYGWAYDSYDYVTFSTRRGGEFNVDGDMVRNIVQLPVSILEPNGIRVVMFLVVASLAGLNLWALSDDYA